MATPYLVRKWKKAFQLIDLNKDNILTIEDAYSFADKAIKGRKLTGQVADEFRAQYVFVFKELYLEGDKETEENMIQRWTNEYRRNKKRFEERMRALLWVFVRISDVKGEGKISKDEYKAELTAMGLVSFDDEYFKAYPQNEDGTIPNDAIYDGLCEYYCNSDDKKRSALEKATCYAFKVIDAI